MRCHTIVGDKKRWWCNGQHGCLPSSRPGFDSRPTHCFLFIHSLSHFYFFFKLIHPIEKKNSPPPKTVCQIVVLLDFFYKRFFFFFSLFGFKCHMNHRVLQSNIGFCVIEQFSLQFSFGTVHDVLQASVVEQILANAANPKLVKCLQELCIENFFFKQNFTNFCNF